MAHATRIAPPKKSTTTTQSVDNVDELDLIFAYLLADSHDIAENPNIISCPLVFYIQIAVLLGLEYCSRADFLRSMIRYPDQLTPLLKNRAVAILQKMNVLLWIEEDSIHANVRKNT